MSDFSIAYLHIRFLGSYVWDSLAIIHYGGSAVLGNKGADGILCNNALRRFNVIFDYSGSMLYIKPNRSFDIPFY